MEFSLKYLYSIAIFILYSVAYLNGNNFQTEFLAKNHFLKYFIIALK